MSTGEGGDWGGGGDGGGDWGGGSESASESAGGGGYREVTSQSWLSRLGGAFVGIPIGLILFAASALLLFWNEGRAVRIVKGLAEGKATVVSIDPGQVDPAFEGKLVHVGGMLVTDELLKDPLFGVSGRAIRLQRIVKMYQWKENAETKSTKKLGGGVERTTNYTYAKDWFESPIDSTKFKVKEGHQNPPTLPFDSWTSVSDKVKLGAFRMPSDLLSQIKQSEPLRMDEAARQTLPDELKSRLKVDQDRYYVGETPREPEIGDATIEFRQVKPTTVSILAAQSADSFRPFRTQSGSEIARLQTGAVSASLMFQAAEEENHALSWTLRLVGFIMMAIGIGLVLRPLSTLADVLPILGNIVGFGAGFTAIALAAVLSLVTIALAWLAFRPLLGGALLVTALVAFYVFFVLRRGRRRRLAR